MTDLDDLLNPSTQTDATAMVLDHQLETQPDGTR